jgi:hypothetical protein
MLRRKAYSGTVTSLSVGCAALVMSVGCGSNNSQPTDAGTATLDINCGLVRDGCGGELSCGKCTSPQTCGGGGTPSVCGTSMHSVTLTWDASSTPSVTYTVLRSTASGSGYLSQVDGLTGLTWTDTAVQSGVTYYYVVDDSLGSLTSAHSNQAMATIP